MATEQDIDAANREAIAQARPVPTDPSLVDMPPMPTPPLAMGADMVGMRPRPAMAPPVQPPSLPSQSGMGQAVTLGGLVASLIGGPSMGGAAGWGALTTLREQDHQAKERWQTAQAMQARQQAQFAAESQKWEQDFRLRQGQLQSFLQQARKSIQSSVDRKQLDESVKGWTAAAQAMGFRGMTEEAIRETAAKGWMSLGSIRNLRNLITERVKDPTFRKAAESPLFWNSPMEFDGEDGVRVAMPMGQAFQMAGFAGIEEALSKKPETVVDRDRRVQYIKMRVAQFEQQGVKVTPELMLQIDEEFAKKERAEDAAKRAPVDPEMAALRKENALLLVQQRRLNLEKSLKESAAGVTLTGGQKEDLGVFESVEKLADKIIALGEESQWAGVGGLGYGSMSEFLAKNFGRGDPRGVTMRADLSNLLASIAKLRGGTSFTTNEEKLLSSYTPGINEDPMSIQTKLLALKDFIGSKRSITMRLGGSKAAPPMSGGLEVGSKFNGKTILKVEVER